MPAEILRVVANDGLSRTCGGRLRACAECLRLVFRKNGGLASALIQVAARFTQQNQGKELPRVSAEPGAFLEGGKTLRFEPRMAVQARGRDRFTREPRLLQNLEFYPL